eukprot:COSAG02_NODE_1210_length_13856_cov_12.266182_6_plen_168_part_00
MRRPVALAGDSNLFTPNRGPVPSRCAPAWWRTAHVRPRGMSRRERLGGANRAKQQLLPLAPPHCHPVYSAEADSRRAWGPPSLQPQPLCPTIVQRPSHARSADARARPRARARATEFLTRVRLIDRISHLMPGPCRALRALLAPAAQSCRRGVPRSSARACTCMHII